VLETAQSTRVECMYVGIVLFRIQVQYYRSTGLHFTLEQVRSVAEV
jgi:hypothetical protein